MGVGTRYKTIQGLARHSWSTTALPWRRLSKSLAGDTLASQPAISRVTILASPAGFVKTSGESAERAPMPRLTCQRVNSNVNFRQDHEPAS